MISNYQNIKKIKNNKNKDIKIDFNKSFFYIMTTIMPQPIQQSIDYKTPPAPQPNYFVDVSAYSFEAMAMAIGKKGKNFIKLTEQFGLSFIWHNKKNETVEIYGDHSNDSPIYSTVVDNIIQMLTLAENTIALRGTGANIEII
tara:strand:- start:375 stop:803 length:429 start_codon:yes stop_codon:yes gene_type:complete